MTVLEICVETIGDAVAAEAAGADRLEICAALADGGVTPSIGLVRAVCAAVRVDVVVLVRVRPGDFVYSAAERAAMRDDILAVRESGAAGVAVGALRADRSLDLEAITAWSESAGGLDVVVHRAFDFVEDPFGSLDDLAAIGVRRILTAGGDSSAFDGRVRLAALRDHAAGRIELIAGGGVRSASLGQLVAATGLRQFHSSARAKRADRSVADVGRRLGAAGGRADQAAFDADEVTALVTALRRASGTP